METLRRDEDAETLRVMAMQIREEMWEEAEETAKEMIDVREERIARSPFDDYSNWYADPSYQYYNHQAYWDQWERQREAGYDISSTEDGDSDVSSEDEVSDGVLDEELDDSDDSDEYVDAEATPAGHPETSVSESL